MSASAEERELVDPVTGQVLETPELRATGLADMRKRMAEAIASGATARFPRYGFDSVSFWRLPMPELLHAQGR